MKLKLGIFVVGGLLVFAAIIFYIGKDKNLFSETFHANAVFRDVGGLQAGNHVRFSGINVGVVDAIQILTDTSVLVKLIIDSDVQDFIKKDAFVTVGSDGLMGDRNLSISQGSMNSEAVKDNHIFFTNEPVNMDEMILSLRNTGENAEIITDQLAEILYKVNNGNGSLSRLISDSTFAEDMSATMNNLKKGSKKLDQNMEAAQKSILLRGFFKKKKKDEAKKRSEEAESKGIGSDSLVK